MERGGVQRSDALYVLPVLQGKGVCTSGSDERGAKSSTPIYSATRLTLVNRYWLGREGIYHHITERRWYIIV